MNVNRYSEIDFAKGIGISLVVLGHLTQRTDLIRIWLYSFHMPLFFIISGYLYKRRTTKQTIRSSKKYIVLVACIVVFDMIWNSILSGGGTKIM